MRILAKAIIPLGLGLLCSCGTHRSHSGQTLLPPELPPEQILGAKAGAEHLLIVTLRLPDGQALPCVVDTGMSLHDVGSVPGRLSWPAFANRALSSGHSGAVALESPGSMQPLNFILEMFLL